MRYEVTLAGRGSDDHFPRHRQERGAMEAFGGIPPRREPTEAEVAEYLARVAECNSPARVAQVKRMVGRMMEVR